MIGDMIEGTYGKDVKTETVALMDYNLTPCILCGRCAKNSICEYDQDFNRLFNKIVQSDALFFIVPHYSPIPSKLLIMFEKLNEIGYGGYLYSKDFEMPTVGKPVGVICHGGCAESSEVLEYYYKNLVKPIGKTLGSLGFDVVGLDKEYRYGVAFGLKDKSCIRPGDNGVFPEIIQDWSMIEQRITPIVKNVCNRVINKNEP
jgi:hypothetical protein